MDRVKQIDILSFCMLGVAIYSIFSQLTNLGNSTIGILNITAIWWIINGLTLFYFWKARKVFFSSIDAVNFKVVSWYLLWNSVCIIGGFFIAETYWDWKGLIANGMALLIPITAFGISNKIVLQAVLSFFLRYTLPLFLVFFALLNAGGYGSYLVPISFLVLFFPAFNSRWKLILVAFSLLILFADFGARSNVIKFSIPFVLVFIFYFKKLLSVHLLELIRKVFFILPVFLFILGINGLFNPFKMGKYIDSDAVEVKIDENGKRVKENLKSDTRTFIYVEVLQTAKHYNSWWFGRSPGRGTISKAFAKTDMNGRGERLGNEVAIANVFTWTGIVGVILYFLVFYKASYLAVNESKNWYSKLAGIFLSFRWTYAWVEDINNYSLTTFFLWILIAICLSKSFREMTDKEFRLWVRGIYDKKYSMKKKLIKKRKPNYLYGK